MASCSLVNLVGVLFAAGCNVGMSSCSIRQALQQLARLVQEVILQIRRLSQHHVLQCAPMRVQVADVHHVRQQPSKATDFRLGQVRALGTRGSTAEERTRDGQHTRVAADNVLEELVRVHRVPRYLVSHWVKRERRRGYSSCERSADFAEVG